MNEQKLLLACKTGDTKQVTKLLHLPEIDVNYRDEDGETPFYTACDNCHVDIVRLLLTVPGVNVTIPDNNGVQPVHIAAYRGHREILSLLLKCNVDIHSQDEYGGTSLFWACLGGHLGTVKWLLSKGADYKIITHDGMNHLHAAAQSGHISVLEFILESGWFDINSQNENGGSALFQACLGGQLETVKWLLSKGVDYKIIRHDGMNHLHIAAQEGHISVLEFILKSGWFDINSQDEYGGTALFQSCYGGRLETVKWLLSKGADYKIIRHDGMNHLHPAAQKGHISVLEFILKSGWFDINSQDKDGGTALFWSCYVGQLETVKWLLSKGADYKIIRHDGRNHLHAAAEKGYISVLEFILKSGWFDINSQDKDGGTALFWSCYGGQLETVKWLLSKGADYKIVRHDGRNLLHVAGNSGHIHVLEFILESGWFDINSQDEYGQTSLFWACYGGHLETVKWLLSKGADYKIIRHDGMNHLHPAAQKGHISVLEFILKSGWFDINSQDKDGGTALFWSCYVGQLETVKWLLSKGADYKIIRHDGRNHLHAAAEKGYISVLEFILASGWFDVNSQMKNGRTPLAISAFQDQVLSFTLLLKCGAKVDCCRNVKSFSNDIMEALHKFEARSEAKSDMSFPESNELVVQRSDGSSSEPIRTLNSREIAIQNSHDQSSILVKQCLSYKTASAFVRDNKLDDILFDKTYDVCFCVECHTSRGDNLYYTRGDPPKDYGLPVGWCKFGLRVPARAHAIGALTNWHVAFHGTKVQNIEKILKTGELLMPGDVTPEGTELRPPPGHFDDRVPGKAPPKGFDISQIYLSPSIRYAGCGVYAPIAEWIDPETNKEHKIRVAFQVRINPQSYKVGPQTVGAKERIDPRFSNDELEWFTKRRGVTVLVGLLVKVQDDVYGGSKDNPKSKKPMPQPGIGTAAASTIYKHKGFFGKLFSKAEKKKKEGILLYPFTSTIGPGTEVKLEAGHQVIIIQEVDDLHFLVRDKVVKKPFAVPKNFIKL